MVYLSRPLLAIFFADRHSSAKYNKLLRRTTVPFQVLQVRDHVLTINENGIANAFSIDRAVPVGS